MLSERVKEWQEQWKQQGLEQGRVEGRVESRGPVASHDYSWRPPTSS